MATCNRNERIALLVIENQIYDYYNSIIDRLLEVNDGQWFSDIDKDDSKAIRARANEVFKSIADVDIFEALSQAFDYNSNTIYTKICTHRRRIDRWVAYYTNTETMRYPKSLAEISYIFQMIESHKTKAYKKMIEGIKNKDIEADILTEKDIYEIKDIINKRSDAIYDGNPDSVVTPALTKFERYMMQYEKEDKASKELSDILNEKEDKASKELADILIEDESKKTDGEIIKKALRDVVETYASMGCNTICFEVDLDDGTRWTVDFRKQIWYKAEE